MIAPTSIYASFASFSSKLNLLHGSTSWISAEVSVKKWFAQVCLQFIDADT
jgi:hypothetical protein